LPKYASDLLLLFDIDGTLVRRAGGHHRQALVDAVRAVTSLETTTEGIPVHGMLDPDILFAMMQRAGMERDAIAAAMPEILKEAERIYEATCPDLRARTCPGVKRLLQHLSRNRVPCVLVTGNLEKIGWKKLDCAGLKRFFLFGSFAGTAHTRTALARNAIRMARKRGLIHEGTKVWLIGDAPQDVLAARGNGISCVAVHTGVSNGRDLGRLRPSRLVKDLGRLRVYREGTGVLKLATNGHE
jgi:phosphoglycolate phosphatase-like HAD superfamily hydrolase